MARTPVDLEVLRGRSHSGTALYPPSGCTLFLFLCLCLLCLDRHQQTCKPPQVHYPIPEGCHTRLGLPLRVPTTCKDDPERTLKG